MRNLFIFCSLLVLSVGQSFAADTGSPITRGGTPTQPSVEPEDLLYETFANVSGDGLSTQIDTSKFDNPGDWTFTDAFAANGGIIIRKGGSVTTPSIPSLTGNATIYFSAGPYEDENHPVDWDNIRPHSLSIVNGELNQSTFDTMVSMESIYIYGAGPETRVTLTADHDINLTSVKLYYGGVGGNFYERYTKVSVPEGEYYNPIEVALTPYMGQGAFNDDGSHNITVYTLDGTNPTRTSTRYDGNPIKIDRTTTLLTGTIFGNGALSIDKPVEYTFPQSNIPEIPANTFTVNVSAPGTLKSMLLDLDADVIEGLVINGKLNGADLNFLIAGEGRTAKLSYVDMENVTFDYDGGLYKTEVFAPEGGMGTVATYRYFLSETNYDENAGGGDPMATNTNCYRNDLTAAFTGEGVTRVVVPKALTSIGERAFSGVDMVVIPDGIEEIGNRAFENASNVNFPSSIRKIGSQAFGPNLIAREINLPNLEYIGDNAFGRIYEYSSSENAGAKILRFVFPDKLSYIGRGAFAGTKLSEVSMTMPGDSIPDGLFACCSDLKTVNIKGDVRYIGDRVFEGCKSIEVFNIPQDIEEIGVNAIPDHLLDNPEGGIYYIGKVAYKRSEDLTECRIKEGTVSLSRYLFDSSSLSKVTLPSSLRIIGDGAFSRTKLTSTPDMEGVIRLGDEAFAFCNELARATIPESLQHVGFNVFWYCNSLWSVNYNAIEMTGNMNMGEVDRITIGDKVRVIPAGLFTKSNAVTEVTLPESVEVIGAEAFYNCINLKSVQMSDNVTVIDSEAFAYCYALEDVHWPANLKKVGHQSFRHCTSLKDIYLPEGMETVGGDAFLVCSNVESIYIASTITDFEGQTDFLFHNQDKEFTITAPATVPQDIEWSWFYLGTPTIKVPAASVEAYKSNPVWGRSKNGGENLIIPIEGTSEPTILAESISLSPDSWSGEEGSSFTITATISPENVTDKSLSWESSDESIATVDASGTVNILKEGTCVITVSTLDGSNLTAKCEITGLAGIDQIFADSNACVDVYSLQGILLKQNCTLEDLKQLQPAIYIIRQSNGKSTLIVNR